MAPSLPPAANSGHTDAIGSSSVDQPGIHQLQREQGDDRLAHGVEVHDGGGRPQPGAGVVGPAADQVDHGAPIDDDAHRRADLAALGEVVARTRSRTDSNDGSQYPLIGAASRSLIGASLAAVALRRRRVPP